MIREKGAIRVRETFLPYSPPAIGGIFLSEHSCYSSKL